MTVGELYKKAVKEGEPYGVSGQDIRILLAFLKKYPAQVDVLLHQDDEMGDTFEFDAYFESLKAGAPIEYVINQTEFLGRKLYVDKNVLIPRMETEELVSLITQKVTNYYDPRNYLVVADIGTGSGAIALSLKKIFKNWLITASDISEAAIKVAKRNFDSNFVSVKTLVGSGLKPYIDSKMNLDIIVSNPPYILKKEDVQKSVYDYEPHEALFLTEENSVYEQVFKDYKKVKKGALWMAFEIGYDLKDYLIGLMNKYLENYEFEFVNDIDGMLRFLFVYLR